MCARAVTCVCVCVFKFKLSAFMCTNLFNLLSPTLFYAPSIYLLNFNQFTPFKMIYLCPFYQLISPLPSHALRSSLPKHTRSHNWIIQFAQVSLLPLAETPRFRGFSTLLSTNQRAVFTNPIKLHAPLAFPHNATLYHRTSPWFYLSSAANLAASGRNGTSNAGWTTAACKPVRALVYVTWQ